MPVGGVEGEAFSGTGSRYYCCTHLFIARRQSVAYVSGGRACERGAAKFIIAIFAVVGRNCIATRGNKDYTTQHRQLVARLDQLLQLAMALVRCGWKVNKTPGKSWQNLLYDHTHRSCSSFGCGIVYGSWCLARLLDGRDQKTQFASFTKSYIYVVGDNFKCRAELKKLRVMAYGATLIKCRLKGPGPGSSSNAQNAAAAAAGVGGGDGRL